MGDLLKEKVDNLVADVSAIIDPPKPPVTEPDPVPVPETPKEPVYDIAWSAKVSPAFCARVKEIANDLKLPPEGADWLMACMAFESGETFSPTIRNGAGAPYYGLIQFGAAAAKDCNTTIPELLKMTAEEQLEYVYRYFKPYAGRLNALSDLYMKILWPAAIGKPEDHVLWNKETRPKTYSQNKGLDIDRNGNITKGEAAKKVYERLVRGRQTEFRRQIV